MEEQPAAQPSRPEQPRRYVPSDPVSRLFWLGILTRQRGDAPLPKDWMRDAACSPATSEEYLVANQKTRHWRCSAALVVR